MSIVDDLLREDDELQKLLRLKRAIDRKLSKLGQGKKKKRARRKDEGEADEHEVADFFDVRDSAEVHDE